MIEKKFSKVPSSVFELGLVDVNLFTINDSNQLSLFKEAGSEITNNEREKLVSKDTQIFVRHDQYNTFLLYVFERIERLVTSKFVSSEDKANLFFKVGESLVSTFHTNPLSKLYFDRFGRYIKSYIDLMLYSREAASHLLALSVEATYKVSHSLNTCTFCMLIGRRLFGNNRIRLWELGIGGMLIDIGMTQIDDHILDKHTSLSEADFSMIQKHVNVSNRILMKLKLDRHIQEMALYHHERYDGSGYPESLKGRDIPMYARIAAVADVYDAITSNRSYKAGVNQINAIIEMYKEVEKFDPVILRALMEVVLKSEKLIVAFSKKHLGRVGVAEITDDYIREESSRITSSRRNISSESEA